MFQKPGLRFTKFAFVVSSDVEYGMGRMAATHAELHTQVDVRVFLDMHEARQWLSE